MTDKFKTWTFKSKTDPTTRHKVQVNLRTGSLSCSCKGWTYASKCWHAEKVLDLLVNRGYKGL